MAEVNVRPKGNEGTSMSKYYFPKRVDFVGVKTNKRVKEKHQEKIDRQEWAFGE